MMAHVLYRSIDSIWPSSQSNSIISLVRGEIGFGGLLMTDDLSMSALTGGMRERTRRCLSAGCDVALHCNGRLAEMEEVAAAAGPLADEADMRASRAAAAIRTPAGDDVSGHIEEFGIICRRAGIAWR